MKLRLALVMVISLLVTSLATVAMAHDDGGAEEEGFASILARATTHTSRSSARCVGGNAAGFPCDNVDLLSFVSLADLGASFVNDMWGWTDPSTGRDFALVGALEGTIFVDVTRPTRPLVVGMLPTSSNLGGPFWRDLKVYADHAYIVSEHSGHGMQVFDLRQLTSVPKTAMPAVFSETALYTKISSAHNIAINEDSGYAYVVGSAKCKGGLHMVNITSPANPRLAGCFAADGYTHDTQCVIYEGPDPDYQGREICFSSNATFDGTPFLNTVAIVDVTDKRNPIPIASVEYPDDGYSHQGWLTDDQTYFLHGDEEDELFYGNPTRTRIWDMTDLDNPTLTGVFENSTASIDHNMYTEGNYLYQSNYTSGLRILDLSAVAGGSLSEVAFFDVYPENDDPSFEGGAWSNYPYFANENLVAVSAMDRGLFLLRPNLSN